MKYYVYILAWPDGTPFYIGKGKEYRITHHEREARQGCDCPKCTVIRTIWSDGGQVGRRIVFETNDEDEALIYERDLIAHYHLESLTNRVEGGRGVSGYRFTLEQLKARRWLGQTKRYITPELPRLLARIGATIPTFCAAYKLKDRTLRNAINQKNSLQRTMAWRIAKAYAGAAGIDEELAYRTIIIER